MSIQAPASARPAVATGVVTGVKVGNYRWYVCGLLFLRRSSTTSIVR